MLICVRLWERRIEAGTVCQPSGGEMRIRASSKSGEFAGEVSAALHVHPNKCGKEGLSWKAKKMKQRGTTALILNSHIDEDLCHLKKGTKCFLPNIRARKTHKTLLDPHSQVKETCTLLSTCLLWQSSSFSPHFESGGGALTKLYPLKWANCVQLTSLDATALTS